MTSVQLPTLNSNANNNNKGINFVTSSRDARECREAIIAYLGLYHNNPVHKKQYDYINTIFYVLSRAIFFNQ